MKIVAANPFRRAVVPLASYYAVTLAVPLANGAARSGGGFLAHAAAVFLTPLVVIALVYGVCGIVSSMISRCELQHLKAWTRRERTH